MRLNKHQREIIKAIANGFVSDIYSYLSYFKKLEVLKYDIEKINELFTSEIGKQKYKVITKPEECYNSVPNTINTPFGSTSFGSLRMLKPLKDIPDDAWEWQSPRLINDLEPITRNYNDKEYSYDFVEGVEATISFVDIIDFITLWIYLKQESLIIEVPKEIEPHDIGIFWTKSGNINSNNEGYVIKETLVDNNIKPLEKITLGDVEFATNMYDSPPLKKMSSYATSLWEINEEYLANCKEFIGKKIVPGSRLKLFIKQGYSTTEEWHYRIPLAISVLALLATIFFQLLPSKTDEYLFDIRSSIQSIERKLDDNSLQVIEEIDMIEDSIKSLSDQLEERENRDKELVVFSDKKIQEIINLINKYLKTDE